MQFFLIFFIMFVVNADEINFQTQLENSEKEVSVLQDRINVLQESIVLQTSAINDLEQKLKSLDSSIHSNTVMIKEHLRATMMYTVPDRIDFLKIVDNYDDFMRGEALISHMLKKDINIYKSYSKELSEINELRVLLDSERAKMLANQDNLKINLEKLKVTVQQKKKILEDVNKDKKKHVAFVNHINKGVSQISNYVKKEGVKLRDSNSSLVKNYIFPAKFSRIQKKFGKIRDINSKSWENNRGVTLETPYGTEVYAASNGSVKFSGWILGFGKVMILEHSDGIFSIYGHLAKAMLNVGDKVKKGLLIALSGDSGSVQNPALYFELRYRDRNIDPSLILNK